MVQACHDTVTDDRFGSPIRVGFAEVSGPDESVRWPAGRRGASRPVLVAVLSADLGEDLAATAAVSALEGLLAAAGAVSTRAR